MGNSFMCVLIEQHLRECFSCRDKVIKAVRTVDAKIAGSSKSKAKSEAARANGAKGGRPRKNASNKQTKDDCIKQE